MPVSRTLTVLNRIEEIRTVEKVLAEFAAQQSISSDVLFQIQLSLEEIFTNVVNYAHDDEQEHEVKIIILGDGDSVTVEVVDDGRPFDPLRDVPEIDTRSSLDRHRVGGAGVALTKRMMTELSYRRDGDHNHLIMTKRL